MSRATVMKIIVVLAILVVVVVGFNMMQGKKATLTGDGAK